MLSSTRIKIRPVIVPAKPPVAPPHAAPAPTAKPTLPPMAAKILTVAWLAIVAGLVLQLLVLMVKATGFGQAADAKALAETAQKSSWSVIVCVAFAFGTAATKARELMNGLIGLLAAPLAFTLAKAAHKGVGHLLQLPADQTPAWVMLSVGLLKAVQYAWLGVVFAKLTRGPAELRLFLLAGLVAGVVFGCPVFVVGVLAAPDPLPAAELVTRMVAELASPIACGVVLYATEAFSKRFTPPA